MNFEPNIPNISSYNERMRKSMIDKIFFFDKFEADVYVDYGCGNGDLIKFMKALFPEKRYYGYDINPKMASAFTENVPDVEFFSDFGLLLRELQLMEQVVRGKRNYIAVICNSLIHEVYAYGNEDSIDLFWSHVKHPVVDFLVIRDMCVSKSVVRQSDALSVFKVRQRFEPAKLEEFERHWGSIEQNWSLVHFLLKYRYSENWEREVRENYLPIDFETITQKFGVANPIFVEHYTLPYIRRVVEHDFGIQLQDRTHLKLILEK